MMSRVAGVEFAVNGVRVNCVSPGPTATKMVRDQWSKDTIEELKKMIAQARPILFLASDESSHITAEMIIVDGGFTGNVCSVGANSALDYWQEAE